MENSWRAFCIPSGERANLPLKRNGGEKSMEPSNNQRIGEYFILSMIIALGTPVCVLWGYQDGEKLAAKAYAMKAEAPAKTAAAPEVGMFLATPENIGKGHDLFQK